MDRAFELAKKGLNTTMPNPRVGCVIVKMGTVEKSSLLDCHAMQK